MPDAFSRAALEYLLFMTLNIYEFLKDLVENNSCWPEPVSMSTACITEMLPVLYFGHSRDFK